ncbi:MAG: phosphoribosylanthranilate isomerase [Puniceicoccaceae bacterium]
MENTTRVKVKVCGLTREEDLLAAKVLGARYFGQIFYSKSPRFVGDEQAAALREIAPFGSRVAVDVEPTPDRLAKYVSDGYNFVQIHFRPERLTCEVVEQWSWAVSPDRLWLAPKLSDLENFNEDWLQFADTILVDSYSKGRFGGNGKTGNWEGFRRLVAKYPDKTFVLAGGLNGDNVLQALEVTGATIIDVNSGVEETPGLKSAEKLGALFAQLHQSS